MGRGTTAGCIPGEEGSATRCLAREACRLCPRGRGFPGRHHPTGRWITSSWQTVAPMICAMPQVVSLNREVVLNSQGRDVGSQFRGCGGDSDG